MGVVAEFFQILNELSSLTQLVNQILTGGAKQDTASATLANTQVLVAGMAVLQGKMDAALVTLNAIQNNQANMQSQLTFLIGNPQQANVPVTLPATPPTGYGGLDATATGNAVWDYVSSDESTTAHVILAALSTFLRFVRDSGAYPIRIGDHFFANFSPFDMIDNPNLSFPSHSAQEILSTDADLGSFLQRIEGPAAWNQLGDGTYWKALGGSFGNALMYCDLTPAEFEWFRANNAGLVQPTPTAPVWPGLANVTYGAPQSMDAPTGSLSGPADGYKIVIDAHPSWAGTYAFDPRTSYRNVGAIAFVDDEGVPEPAQTLGLDTVIYLPKSMAHSVGAYYRLNIGYHCVATAFTIN